MRPAGLGKIGNQASLREAGMNGRGSDADYGNYSPSVIDTLKKVEQKNQVPMTGVQILFNSPFPAQLDAKATAFGGKQVDIGPGAEDSFKHELGHIVQQRLDLVKADGKVNNRLVCKNPTLEEDATRRGSV